MGEVYRARDGRLGRDVAIKVLPAGVAGDPERLQRFEQEARAAAALNHPNILAVYDIGQHNSSEYIVSELLDGETLRDRLDSGALPVRKAIDCAIQIAHGLSAAHEKGITHRDLKPENLFVTSDGRVKILDFGLAKLTQSEAPSVGASVLPTTPPQTLPGVVLGTIGYMAPEQVRGQQVDHRSDIFAFGAILYELLSGQRAFQRETAAETMTAILKDEPPDLPAVERHIPPALARIVDRCLEKTPTARFKSADDLAFALDALSAHSDAAVSAATGERRRLFSNAGLAWSVAAVLAVVAMALAITRSAGETSSPRPVTRLELNLPAGVELFTYGGQSLAVSPDGTRVAFVGVRGAARQIYIRALDSLAVAPISGTDSLWTCFFSFDGRSIGYLTGDRSIRAVSLADGLVTTVVSDIDLSGAAWGDDNRIVFVRNGALWRIPSSGGAPEQLMTLDAGRKEVRQAWPTVLPGAHAILFASSTGTSGDTRIEALVLATRERRLLVERGTRPQYVASGHLVFHRDGKLLAAPFDAENLTVGSPKPVQEDVPEGGAGTPVGDVSPAGTLVYAPATATSRLVAVSRSGTEQALVGELGLFVNPRFAPGATRLVVQRGGDLWIQDLTRGGSNRVTSVDVAEGAFPVWAQDDRVVFHSATGMRVLSVETGQTSEAVAGTGARDFPGSVSKDGEQLVFQRMSPDSSGDLYVTSLKGDPQIKSLLKTQAFEGNGRLSPDGHWIVYSSEERGRMEVFVASFPQFDRKTPVSTEGGTQALWNPNGREIFYRSGTRMMSVDVSTSPFVLGTPHPLFDRQYAFATGVTIPNYDFSAERQQFVMVKDESGAGRLNVVLNWTEELKRLVPAN
jgi:hypothetical protein